MRQAVLRLEKLGDESRRRFERDQGQKSWFRDWDAMPESSPVAEVDDEKAPSGATRDFRVRDAA